MYLLVSFDVWWSATESASVYSGQSLISFTHLSPPPLPTIIIIFACFVLFKFCNMEGRANELNMTNGIHTKCDKTFYSGGVIRYLVLDWKSGERDKSTDLK